MKNIFYLVAVQQNSGKVLCHHQYDREAEQVTKLLCYFVSNHFCLPNFEIPSLAVSCPDCLIFFLKLSMKSKCSKVLSPFGTAITALRLVSVPKIEYFL